MELNLEQKITIAAWAITYDNDREAVRQARCDFNVALQPKTVGKWRKLLLETGRPHSSTDATATERILEECACSTSLY